MGADPSTSTRPSWLGTRVLPLRADGFGEVQPTPPELRDRRFPPPEGVPRAETDRFVATISDVPEEVVARSTWSPTCPVAVSELRYVTLSFWGFDGRAYRGELLVHASAAQPVVTVFERLFEAGFPIEEMRVVSRDEVDAPPTGDGNNTTAFVCRPARGATSWSEHAYGLAVDINPFHNPYVKGDLVLSELASAYTDRGWERPGMIVAGDVVTEAFAAIGWGWGGDWRTSVDWMHFSRSGR
ncbi:MAG: M15 family metallopeptidase [Actinomycetota bacterium]|nr:M15 family metallopeptidase [Actinomycetota bacterium]